MMSDNLVPIDPVDPVDNENVSEIESSPDLAEASEQPQALENETAVQQIVECVVESKEPANMTITQHDIQKPIE